MPILPKIFIAYARKDSDLLEELRIHLKPLERTQRALIWYDGMIEPGAVWEADIKKNLHSADIILLLVSAQSIASDYFYEKEMTDALERHERGEAKVIPVIIKPCTWKATSLSKLQALPKDGKAVTSWGDRDEAWNDTVEALLSIMEGRQNLSLQHINDSGKSVKPTYIHWLQQQEPNLTKPTKILGQRITEDSQRRRSLDPFHDIMIPIKGGTFKMGDLFGDLKSHSSRVHDVSISDFQLCKHPVTQAQWRKIMGNQNNPSHFIGDDLPVEMISWDDVQVFIGKLNEKTGEKYRLPSEAEWEYAARGGDQTKNYKFAGSDNLEEVAWFSANSNEKTHPVMMKKANEIGIYDMSGNVWEWCQDIYHGSYKDAPKDGSAWTSGSEPNIRVVRGGSWDYQEVSCRSSDRGRDKKGDRFNSVGFRLAR